MKGGGAAGIATLGTAGVQLMQQVLAETETAILTLLPYLQSLCWVFITVALVGIGVTTYARLGNWRRGLRSPVRSSLRSPDWHVRPALRYGVIDLALLLFLLAPRRTGERVGRLTERFETTERNHDVQRQMIEAAARRPRSRDDLAERLRNGQF